MNRTTTVLVALIAAASLSTMAYTVPEQRTLAWGGFSGCGFGFGGCGGFFGIHKHVIQTISQTNTCLNPTAHTPIPPPPPPPPPPPVPVPAKAVGIGGIGGSGGAAGSGGEGGQAGKNIADMSGMSKTDVNQKANGGNSNGGRAGNANGGEASVANANEGDENAGNSNGGTHGNGNDQISYSNDGQEQKDKQTICINTAVNHGRP
jgi:hypothetical protein